MATIKTLAVVMTFVCTLSICSIVETTYFRKGVVVKVENETVIVKDEQGELWDFLGDDYSCGDIVNLKMDDNHTHQTDDDIVKDAIKIN